MRRIFAKLHILSYLGIAKAAKMRFSLLIVATLLALGAVLTEGTAEVDGQLQKKQDTGSGTGVPCMNEQAEKCLEMEERQTRQIDPGTVIEGCKLALDIYRECKDLASTASTTTVGPVLLTSTFLTAVAAVLN